MGLMWREIGEIVWPGLVVLVAHAILGALFGHEPYVDPVMHFSGGIAAAYFFLHLPRLTPRYFGKIAPVTRYLLGFGLVTVVAVLWEFGEYLADFFLSTRMHQTIGGTLRDLFNGMSGATVLMGIDFWLWRRREPCSPDGTE